MPLEGVKLFPGGKAEFFQFLLYDAGKINW